MTVCMFGSLTNVEPHEVPSSSDAIEQVTSLTGCPSTPSRLLFTNATAAWAAWVKTGKAARPVSGFTQRSSIGDPVALPACPPVYLPRMAACCATVSGEPSGRPEAATLPLPVLGVLAVAEAPVLAGALLELVAVG